MSRQVTHTGNCETYPNNITGSTYSSISDQSNAYASATSTTYASANTSSNSTQELYWVFNSTDLANSIPDTPTTQITSVGCSAKAKTSSSSRFTSATMTMYSGTTSKGSSTSFRSTTESTYSLASSNWTRAEVLNARIRVETTRSNQGGNHYASLYGATITVDWSWVETIYSISASSSSETIAVSVQSAETTSGGSNVVTLTNVSDLTDHIIKDGNTDISSQLVSQGGGVYTYTLTNISADHSITVVDKPKHTINVISYYQSASITASTGLVVDGKSVVITLVVDNISTVIVSDNSVDVTSQFVGSSGTYTYTLTNVTADHTIVADSSGGTVVPKDIYIKKNGTFHKVTALSVKENGSWVMKSISDIWYKVNGLWSIPSTSTESVIPTIVVDL